MQRRSNTKNNSNNNVVENEDGHDSNQTDNDENDGQHRGRQQWTPKKASEERQRLSPGRHHCGRDPNVLGRQARLLADQIVHPAGRTITNPSRSSTTILNSPGVGKAYENNHSDHASAGTAAMATPSLALACCFASRSCGHPNPYSHHHDGNDHKH